MIQMTLQEAANFLNSKAETAPVTFTGVSIDSRTITPNALFVAIPGERVDGHDFIEMAREKGAAAALVTRKVDSTLPQLVVDDIDAALGKLGAAWRQRFAIPFIAVTGSNGKTTLKNLIGSIFIAACQQDSEQVLITQGTLNNHLGLPLTLLRLSPKHRYAVIEMGMNHFGEIEYLTKLTQPHIAVITNAGASHLEGVGDLAGVARAKAEIFLGLDANGIAILNKDDTFYSFWLEKVGKRQTMSFGFQSTADVHATLHESTDKQHITIHTPQGEIDVMLPLLGKHNVQNALAATVTSLAANIDLAAIKAGLEQATPANGRMQTHTLKNGTKIIDDTYNANPFSLQAAIMTLATFKGQRILVLGDMKELGANEKAIHQEAGTHIRNAGIDYLFTYGELTHATATAFGQKAQHFNDQIQLLDALKPLLDAKTTILVKGSRSMRMEAIVKNLLASTDYVH